MNAVDEGTADPIAGWNAETRAVAGNSWLYAQLSTNAYLDEKETFILPGDVVERYSAPNDRLGYSYAIYDRFEGQELVETIIAYRGTEFNYEDWILGNFLGRQNPHALVTAIDVNAQLDVPQYADVELSVTGHSLGGALAHYVSLHQLDDEGGAITRSVVFNNSPRFSGYPNNTDRTAVVERGDWLSVLRLFGAEPDQLYQSLNCQPGFAPIRDHAIRELAECLTWIAAYEDPDARLSVASNPAVGRPASQADDLPLPAAPTLSRGVPVNPYIDDVDLRIAVNARLLTSVVLSPFYELRVGYRVQLEGDVESGTFEAVWRRNGQEQLRAAITCSMSDVSNCADKIVTSGEVLVADQLAKID